jgi:sec-independent protein translocase protein TatB
LEILGIGPLELVLILILALIILGPKDMEKAGRKLAQGLVKIIRSDTWKTVSQTSQKLKTLPNELMREAGLEEIKKDISPIDNELKKLNKADWSLTKNLINEPLKVITEYGEKEPAESAQEKNTPARSTVSEKPPE